MKIILLCGGSGKRLWPLSNETRSKQFLQLLDAPNGEKESMIQRMGRQIAESKLDAEIIIATSESQHDAIINQLGTGINIVTEPQRRDTFPAIALSASYLIKEMGCSADEVVVVMPSDSYVDASYFESIAKMVDTAHSEAVDMVLMGITPTSASTKFGYIVPRGGKVGDMSMVERFTEKPNAQQAEELIAHGAVWNGGVFAFRLGYISSIIDRYITSDSFAHIRSHYSDFPKISFDYEVVEGAASVAYVPYSGEWSDLGTWNSLCRKIEEPIMGKVLCDGESSNTHIINESTLPIISLGCKDMVIAASPDGILVSQKDASPNLKGYADTITERPMYEERRWGTYKIMGLERFSDGYKALTKYLRIKAGCSISYQYHNLREEVWTFVDGEGLIAIDGQVRRVGRGDVTHIKAGTKHSVQALTDLQIIEVQSGMELSEEDITRLDWEW